MRSLLILLLAVAGPVAAAPAAVDIGGVEVPADCALARKEHPRLLFTRADIPRLRERLKNPRLAAELQHARDLAAQGKAGAILLGVLYYLTDDRSYIEQARAKLQPSWIQTYPFAADLVMGAMTPAEQQAEAERMVAILQKERWRPHLLLDLAAWGHGQDEYLEKDIRQRYHEDLERPVAYNNLWSQGRGGSSMSHGYYGEHFYSEVFAAAVAWSTATGQDWVAKCDFAAHTPEYYLYHYRPWGPPSVVHIGVVSMARHWETLTPGKFEGENLAVLAAARFHDGLGQYWVDEVISKLSAGYNAVGQGGIWGKLLWLDPELRAVAPAQLPPARLFPENGHVVMRSDWTPDATYALFRCGRYGEIDGWWGRNNADNLSFLIEKKGILAADTGGVHSLNNGALSFAGNKGLGEGLPHMTEYARQTIAHNSILVGGEALSLKAWNNTLLGTVRAGGQSPIQDKTWWQAWGLPEPKQGDRPFKEGEIVAYETSPLFDYAAGDATHSYPPERVKSITRQFVYLRPDTFVVFDRVAAAAPGLPITWLLHSLYEPAWNGARRTDDSIPPEKQQIVAPDGTLAPNPRPGGRFLCSGGDTFTLDDRWPDMTGRLFARVLLPDEGARVVRTVGGAWHDFEVDGTNYGPTEETYGELKGAANPHNRENSIGVEGWRIEMSPAGTPSEASFLVVLHAADQNVAAMPPVERITRDGRAGARVAAGGKVYEVTFATAGPVGGHITVTEAGRVLADRDLAAKVENNYRGWSADPRYQAWTTRPEYRSFIGQ